MIYFIRIITITFVLLLVSGCDLESESKETTDSGTTTIEPTTPDTSSSPKTTDRDDTNTTTVSLPKTIDKDDNSTTTTVPTTPDTSSSSNTTDADDDNTPPTNPLTTLKIKLNKTSLNLGEKTSIAVTGTFKDNTTKELNDQVEWIITPKNSVKINNATLTTIKDNNTTIRAKIGRVVSNAVDLEIYWEVDGHKLPPEPDPTVNNSTLLGIDVNDNGVRDDVERYIYKKYKQPVERGILMQTSRAYNSLLSTQPVKHQANSNMNNVTSCLFYWIYEVKPSPFDEYDFYEHYDEVKAIQFNTVKRLVTKRNYELSLSGGVYSLIPKSKGKCEFDENGILGEIK